MAFAPGARLGPYEILEPLGAGGMGEVYRAHDSRLDRSVAIKVLPAHLSSSPEVRARFEREARTVSALSHPHICVLYDVGHQDGIDYLVMELVEGETLAHRLQRGPLPAAEVLRLGVEIADALDRAHRGGIVHRDLKPGNVMLTRSGAKLMDFGLARTAGLVGVSGRSGSMDPLSQSPTVAAPLTTEGTIIGTFQYMAPEQLEGREADARSDLWALGCVLYEMATAKRAFEGKSQASLIAAILEHQPVPISTVRASMPPALDRVIGACLAKDPEERIQTAHDVKLQLQWIGAETPTTSVLPLPAGPRRASWARERTAWALAVVLVGTLAFLAGRSGRHRPPALVARFDAHAPLGMRLSSASSARLSPDGTRLVFAAFDSTGSRLWIRPLDSQEPKGIAGTEGASYPFWSPDGKTIGFFASGKLKKVPAEGGPIQVLCDAPSGRGGAWSRQGVIVFAPSGDGPLHRVSASGGTPVEVMPLDSVRHESAHRWPCFLPDGRRFLYVSLPPRRGQCETFLASLDGKQRKAVLSASQGAVFAEPNHVIFTRDRTIIAQRFDSKTMRLRGEPIAIAELRDVSANLGEPCATASSTGALVYIDSRPGSLRLVWWDRAGRELETLPVVPGPYGINRLSPDGRLLSVVRHNTPASQDILVIDVLRSTVSRLVAEPGFARDPVWSRDSRRLYYASNRDGPYDIFARSTTGDATEEKVFGSRDLLKFPEDVTPDGRYLIFNQDGPSTRTDLWLVPLDGSRKAVPWLRTPHQETGAAISPNGHWVAYASDESGRFEVYVRPFSGEGPRIQVSNGGGFGIEWRSDGGEIVYASMNGLMAVDVRPGSVLDVGSPHLLFKFPRGLGGWAASPDHRRFLVGLAVEERSQSTATVLLNWMAAHGP